MSNEEKSEFIFTWRIENYSSCYQKKGAYIDSPSFTVENLVGSQWKLSFCPKGTSKWSENMSCYLEWRKTDNKVTETPSIDFSVDILDMVGCELYSYNCENRVFSVKSPSWGSHEYMAIDLLATEMENWEEDVLTLRCKIKCDKFGKQTIFGAEACTTLDVERRFFEWDITAPSLFKHSESTVFPIKVLHNFEITLTFLLEGLQFLIHLKEHQSDLSQPVVFKITLCDKKNEYKIASKRAGHSFKDSETWKFPDFITRNLLEGCKLDSIRTEFKLLCEIGVSKKRILLNRIQKFHLKSSFVCPCAVAAPEVCPATAMQKDFRNLFINKKHFDVTIRVHEEDFPAHKLVLRMRSPVFEAMFDQNMLENETGVVNVTDIDGKIMKTFLEFLYTETVDKMDYESAKKLLFAADKYQVPSLVNECVSYLKSVLSVENACEIICIADSINCECLKSYAFDFIISNAAKILINPNWRPWIKQNIDLATDIVTKLSTDLITKYK